jgi:hypothetical protein
LASRSPAHVVRCRHTHDRREHVGVLRRDLAVRGGPVA